MGVMSLPDWRSFSGGGTKRAALWLLAEVGEGRVFTKAELRSAFPRESQIDRRVRDLRAEGWVIHTNREDASLHQDEQRLITVGGRIWERGYQSRKERAISATERQAVLAKDHYACSLCGISGGEPYPDDPLLRAKLRVARVARSIGPTQFSTVCDRCHQGHASFPDISEVRQLATQLDEGEFAQLRAWIAVDRRSVSPAANVWAAYRHLPSESRDDFKRWLFAHHT